MKNIFIAIIVIVMLPLLFVSINNSGDSGNQELKGFSARDIQFIESIGFVDNLDGSWTLTALTVTTATIYNFDFIPISLYNGVVRTEVKSIKILSSTSIRLVVGNNDIDMFITTSTIILWGGDVS